MSCRNTIAKVSIKHFIKQDKLREKNKTKRGDQLFSTLLRRNEKDQCIDTPTKRLKFHIPKTRNLMVECDSGDLIIFR